MEKITEKWCKFVQSEFTDTRVWSFNLKKLQLPITIVTILPFTSKNTRQNENPKLELVFDSAHSDCATSANQSLYSISTICDWDLKLYILSYFDRYIPFIRIYSTFVTFLKFFFRYIRWGLTKCWTIFSCLCLETPWHGLNNLPPPSIISFPASLTEYWVGPLVLRRGSVIFRWLKKPKNHNKIISHPNECCLSQRQEYIRP